MNATIQIKVLFSPVFRALLGCQERNLLLDAERPNVGDLLKQLSRESAGKIDALIFEKETDTVSTGLMIKVDDRVYTGNLLNQAPVPLKDHAVVTMLYYVSGG